LGFYLIEHIEQGTTEWLNWRKGVIGASDAPTIMGENPWRSPSYLLKEKLGNHKEWGGNEATREGSRLEEVARQIIAKEFKQKLSPAIVQDSKDPFLAASLDALSSKNTTIYEIKCGAKSYELTSATDEVPSYYAAQLQHMLMVTQLDSLFYASYRPGEELIILEIYRDESYIKELRKRETKFIKELVKLGHKVQKNFYGKKVS
jgi:putative phage-type endonuclease